MFQFVEFPSKILNELGISLTIFVTGLPLCEVIALQRLRDLGLPYELQDLFHRNWAAGLRAWDVSARVSGQTIKRHLEIQPRPGQMRSVYRFRVSAKDKFQRSVLCNPEEVREELLRK